MASLRREGSVQNSRRKASALDCSSCSGARNDNGHLLDEQEAAASLRLALPEQLGWRRRCLKAWAPVIVLLLTAFGCRQNSEECHLCENDDAAIDASMAGMETYDSVDSIDPGFQCENAGQLEFFRVSELTFLRKNEGCDLDEDGKVDNEIAEWIFLGLSADATVGTAIPGSDPQLVLGLARESPCGETRLWIGECAELLCSNETPQCYSEVIVDTTSGGMCNTSLATVEVDQLAALTGRCEYSGAGGELPELGALISGFDQAVSVERVVVDHRKKFGSPALILCGHTGVDRRSGSSSSFALAALLESVVVKTSERAACSN